MHKKIKYIIAATLVVAAVSGFAPSNNFLLGSVEAYASTYNDASNGELKSLDLTWVAEAKLNCLIVILEMK